MIRIRRAAPSMIVLGTLLIVLSMASAAVAQVVNAAKSDSTLAALVIDRLAYLAVANLTAWAIVLIGLWRWSGGRIATANRVAIAEHNADKDAHEAAAHANHQPLEQALSDLDRAMAEVLGEVRRVATMVQSVPELDRRLRAIEQDHAEFHGRRYRIGDPEGEDHTGERGR